MPLLFSYGTLQHDDVQMTTFGRKLAGRADSLPGFEPDEVTIHDPAMARALGRTHHANVKPSAHAGAAVAGTQLEVTDDELARADEFEAQFSYGRIRVTLTSGHPAWVYVHRPVG
jgi:hypothetical protein